MKRRIGRGRMSALSLLLLILWSSLTSCAGPGGLPTRAIPAANPTPLPSAAAPDRLPTPLSSEPTPTPLPTHTPVIPSQRPTTAAPTGINITSPAEGSEVVNGRDLTVGGLAQLEVTETISVTLTSLTGLVLGRAAAESTGFSSWQAILAVAPEVSGAADLHARVLDETGAIVAEAVQMVRLAVDPAAEGPALRLFRPLDGQTAVAGYNMFFDGRNVQPAGNRVTVALWSENCQVEAARQSFQLRGSGYWQGFLIVPRDLRGPACALAYFGVPGEDNWRQAEERIEVLDPAEPNALQVAIANPPPDSTVPAGKVMALYGTAYNAPDRQVLLTVLLENGRVLTEGIAAVNLFGYWELELFIPADASGLAHVTATIGQLGDPAFAQTLTSVTIGSPE